MNVEQELNGRIFNEIDLTCDDYDKLENLKIAKMHLPKFQSGLLLKLIMLMYI